MNTTSVPLSKRMFRALLRVLPADFRSDYGREMEHAFDDQEREARDRERVVRRSVRRLEDMGYQVTLEPVAKAA